jgi:hypothetical protein
VFPGAAFDFVNARRGVNVQQLRDIIRAQSSVDKRLRQVRRELLRAWTDLNAHFRNVFRLEIPWRRDSLERFLFACSPHADLHEINAQPKRHA